MNRIGPNTEPWGTPVASRVGDDLQPEHETVEVVSDRYEENQERSLPRRKYHKDKRCSSMEWSIVSKAAGRFSSGISAMCMIVCDCETQTVSLAILEEFLNIVVQR